MKNYLTILLTSIFAFSFLWNYTDTNAQSSNNSDFKTLATKACSTVSHPLYYGVSTKMRNEVSFLQQFLFQKGYLGTSTDIVANIKEGNELKLSIFGAYTLAAVKKFQKDNNVPATGTVGPLTRSKITSVCLSYYNSPEFQKSIEVARVKASDAAIKAGLANMRAQAELIYDQSNNSYASVCTDAQSLKVFQQIQNVSSSTVKCVSNATAYAISSVLKSDQSSNYCVDNSGFSGLGVVQQKNSVPTCGE
ncbi:MAG: peptidoglycan-binding domain-containing protein [bacterium]